MVKRPPKKTRDLQQRRGVALTELAVCLPILLLLAVAVVEACAMIYLKQSVSIAAYEGARMATIPGKTQKDVAAQCQGFLSGRNVRSSKVDVSPNPDSALPGTLIRVSVSAPCSANSPLVGRFFVNRTVAGTCEMVKEL